MKGRLRMAAISVGLVAVFIALSAGAFWLWAAFIRWVD